MVKHDNNKINYVYKMGFALEEASVINYPITKPLNGNATTIKKINEKINKQFKNDLNSLRIWIYPFFSYEKTLIIDIEQSLLLRSSFISKKKNIVLSEIDLYNEYVAWLTYMKKLSLKKPIKPLKKYYLAFFSLYNKLYIYDYKQQKQLRRHNYALNYFIVYWFKCQPLEEILNLPLFTEFVPYYKNLNPKLLLKNKKN